MRQTIFIVFLFFVCEIGCHAATPKLVKINSNGKTVISANLGKGRVEVTIRTREVQVSRTGTIRPDYLPSTCTYAAVCSIVEGLEIAVDGKAIFVPQSVISDMAWIHTAELRLDANMMLLLSEGDASESYFIRIDFDKERVKRMREYVDSSMNNNRLLTDTNYYLVED
jgi:hypothetical protein